MAWSWNRSASGHALCSTSQRGTRRSGNLSVDPRVAKECTFQGFGLKAARSVSVLALEKEALARNIDLPSTLLLRMSFFLSFGGCGFHSEAYPWVRQISEAYLPLRASRPTQKRPLKVMTCCSGTSSPIIALGVSSNPLTCMRHPLAHKQTMNTPRSPKGKAHPRSSPWQLLD